jgi:hypothetical protein
MGVEDENQAPFEDDDKSKALPPPLPLPPSVPLPPEEDDEALAPFEEACPASLFVAVMAR